MNKTTIAYCPTMEPFAETLVKVVKNVETIDAGSAAQALQMLRGNYVDSVLIGRVAKKIELSNDSKELRLRNGVTLIYKMKTGINSNGLSNIPVRTYLSESELGELKNQFSQILFEPTLEDCFVDSMETPALIDWRDYRDEFELLIPMTETGKDPRFRAPVLYYKDLSDEILSEISTAIQQTNN